MIVNQNPCVVDIRRKPGCMQWEIYCVEKIDKDHIGVMQPVQLAFMTQDNYSKINPAFELPVDPQSENWFIAIADAIFNAFPHLRDKYATKRNENEIYESE